MSNRVGTSALQSGKTLTSLIGSTPIPSSLGTTITGAIDSLKGGSLTSVSETINWAARWDQHEFKAVSRLNTSWKELDVIINSASAIGGDLQFHFVKTSSNSYLDWKTFNMKFVGGGAQQFIMLINLNTSSNSYSVQFKGYIDNRDSLNDGVKLNKIIFYY